MVVTGYPKLKYKNNSMSHFKVCHINNLSHNNNLLNHIDQSKLLLYKNLLQL